jgi:hypothetical protein
MAGQIDELGWLRSWESQGFNDSKCLSELIDNSIDAGCKNFNFIVDKKNNKMYIIDDGVGMNLQELKDMYNVYHSNSNCNRIGNYGFGTKPAQLLLSRKTNTKIITKKSDDKYYTANANWGDIIKKGKYSGEISILESTNEEIELFNKHNYSPYGTVIVLPIYKEVVEIIELQFNIEYDDEILPNDLWCVIYGRFDININYHYIGKTSKKLKLYNPLDYNNDYDTKINEYTIQYYTNPKEKHDRFIVELETPDGLKEYEIRDYFEPSMIMYSTDEYPIGPKNDPKNNGKI